MHALHDLRARFILHATDLVLKEEAPLLDWEIFSVSPDVSKTRLFEGVVEGLDILQQKKRLSNGYFLRKVTSGFFIEF